MPDTKYENLLQYDLKIYRNDILEKEKKKNDLRNILFFPSLFWFNGQFCPPIPVVKYYSNLCAFKVKDYVTCSIHKFSVIIRRIVKNEIVHVNMFNEKKVLSCVFYINIDYILKLSNIINKYMLLDFVPLTTCLVEKENELIKYTYKKNISLSYKLFCYNEKNEIHLFDVEKNKSLLSFSEKNQITCLTFNFLYISKKNSLYNKLFNDIYDENKIKIVDIDNIDKQIVTKNMYCFELSQDKINNTYNTCKDNEKHLKIFKNLFYLLIYGDDQGNVYFFVPQKNVKIKKKLRNEKINLIETNVKEYFKVQNINDLYHNIKNNHYIFVAYKECIQVVQFYFFEIYFVINFVHEKLYSMTTKFNNLGQNYLSFSTKNYVKIYNINEMKEINCINNNIIQKRDENNEKENIILHEIDKSSENQEVEEDQEEEKKKKKHCLIACPVQKLHEQTGEKNINENYKEIICDDMEYKKYENNENMEEQNKDDSLIYTSNKNHKNDNNKNISDKKDLKYYTCIHFDSADNIYISSDKGIINVYNLNEKRIIKSFHINCKIIFYLFFFILNNKEYIYIYDSEKFYCLYVIDEKKNVYKIFTLSLWIYHIICFDNNIIFSLGNENIYNLQLKKYNNNKILNSIYSNNINICIFLINHPQLPIIAFINKKSVFGFFYLTKVQKKRPNQEKNIIIPNIRENQHIISICWFGKPKNIIKNKDILFDYDNVNDIIEKTNNSNDVQANSHCVYESVSLNNNHIDIIENNVTKENKKKKRKKMNMMKMEGLKSDMNNNIYPNTFDTYLVILNEKGLYLYNIITNEILKLNNDLLNNLYEFKGKKYMASTIFNNEIYVFILYEKKLLFFNHNMEFDSYDINLNEKINKMYLKDNILFLLSNSNIYFIFIEYLLINLLNKKFNVLKNCIHDIKDDTNGVIVNSNLSNNINSDIIHADNHIEKLEYQEKENEKKYVSQGHELYITKLKFPQNFKILLFDFYYMTNGELYIAIFSKKKKIMIYKINLYHEDYNNRKQRNEENTILEIEAQLIAQFINFYIFEHINKVGSILCMKFFYNSEKKKIYLVFGGLEQFLFSWNFLKYPIIQKK
ncbi:hypothetical protein PFAG_03981 [Plasmodium falciparum Santa Lucia]|uniref:WD repeat-containing protein, putative n=10 Tax=Plasmodium falciparum TaxID=5833 RepID=Q8I5A2_PLAF7|nr:WD repeat-containing protein, putative [Plasmodium falciparum 3D7]ETW29853.1 hypothetical protein PFFCH_02626 [Plasmodium falciparum FCH/4]ETW48170.1 hypothetical protein PFMALIP_03875 [Plasmodium falciparum MaliPS096_E11]ETW56010.1 hypothetical protein PFUGPA_02054 [Plasmodium falciparum Palo Alto/Uganda]ETW60131.1 hypothetical protein PFMC_03903 [Plasmodium falciparum CAMP/Malaysia]EUR68060.1 hypothetical protein PFBG_04025 [Plasmodium falciparum 7G8]EUT82606.1 hypothetical protein PFAG_|eukprot:XP_001350713.1 conserved Plasmodium protein, unknown function [Plasmodium falciparum 3D7]